jgi:hypothetical protein
VLGRYVCNGLDEELASAAAHPFEIIVIGGGSFGPIFAQQFMYRDSTRARRILVLVAGRFTLPGHVQNMPMLGLNVPGPTTVDPGTFRNEV